MKRSAPFARPIDGDRRQRFPLGRLKTAPEVREQLGAVEGSDTEAGFRLGSLLARHSFGWGGHISLEDRMLNEFVMREYALRGTNHVILSRHVVEGVYIEIVTNLGEHQTFIGLPPTSPRSW